MSTTDDATGDLAAALAALERLGGDQPLPEHVDAFEHVHNLLQDRLAQAEN
ncbi:hypothetical protein [Ruania halotolerans]|uniref:hypothetical protein n=1 Tax=Ruania halotolerans TaxID=2897773 RepID=UPI001E2D7CB2|nr:hypothetical protein [Ruania halotolerans]UFU05058.1 hypothetical protein LQF10_11280 [Ruania halotolerans]